MRRTITPKQRQRFLQENIKLNIKEEENDSLVVKVLLSKIQDQNYPDDAEIILEVYNRINIERLKLGNIKDYKEEEQTHELPFEVPVRAKINFRLKIIDPNSFMILGYAENLKEEKYAKSLIDANDDDDVKNIYRIDFYNPDHPIISLNPKLAGIMDTLKPIIAEMILKDILNYLLIQNDTEDYGDHKWFKFAERLSKYDENEHYNADYKSDWINKVLCKFSETNKLIDKIIKQAQAND